MDLGTAAAVPVSGAVIASLGTAGPLSRLDAKRRATVIERIRATAAKIARDLTTPGNAVS